MYLDSDQGIMILYVIWCNIIINLCRRKGRKLDEVIKIFEEKILKSLTKNWLKLICQVGRLLDAWF